jgi:hypothetical protein
MTIQTNFELNVAGHNEEQASCDGRPEEGQFVELFDDDDVTRASSYYSEDDDESSIDDDDDDESLENDCVATDVPLCHHHPLVGDTRRPSRSRLEEMKQSLERTISRIQASSSLRNNKLLEDHSIVRQRAANEFFDEGILEDDSICRMRRQGNAVFRRAVRRRQETPLHVVVVSVDDNDDDKEDDPLAFLDIEISFTLKG